MDARADDFSSCREIVFEDWQIGSACGRLNGGGIDSTRN